MYHTLGCGIFLSDFYRRNSVSAFNARPFPSGSEISMIAILQRVNHARINVDGRCIASMDRGVLAFIAYERGDTPQKSARMLERISNYRIFSDEAGKINLNVGDAGGNMMLVPQFTLAANTDRGNRPSFDTAMPPADAAVMFAELLEMARAKNPDVQCGMFGADMKILLENDGPVTFSLYV